MIVLPSMPLRNPNGGLVYHGQHFSAQECDAIVASAIDSEWREGGVGGHGEDKSVPSTVASAECGAVSNSACPSTKDRVRR